jgi:hypothetical protein
MADDLSIAVALENIGCIPCFLRDLGGYNFMGFSAVAIFTILAAAKPLIGVPVICRNYSRLLG